jgi:outer membrane lipoprotein
VESEVYAKGREVTGAGKVVGSKTGKVDDRDYRYPVIEVEELHLFERRERFYLDPYLGNPYSPWRDPFYW